MISEYLAVYSSFLMPRVEPFDVVDSGLANSFVVPLYDHLYLRMGRWNLVNEILSWKFARMGNIVNEVINMHFLKTSQLEHLEK